jgi:hypothetical protein
VNVIVAAVVEDYVNVTTVVIEEITVNSNTIRTVKID